MSRKTIVVLTMILFSTCIFAQTGNTKKGYRGDVSLGDMFGLGIEYGSVLNFQTTHGVYFSDGAFLGAGIGAVTDFNNLMIPVFIKVSQTFCRNNTLNPYVSVSLGCYLNVPTWVELYASPEIGIEISRFRLFCNYSSYQNSDDCYWHGRVGEKVRSLTLGVGLRFGKMEKHY